MRAIPCQQRSDVWFLARCGAVTSSRAIDVCASGRGGYESRTRARYQGEVICEQLSGVPTPPRFRPTRAMRRGLALEPTAIAAYAAHTGQTVHRVGFLAHDTLRAGTSLDGYVGDFEGVVEVKVPNRLTHLRTLATRRIPRDYRLQVTHHLWITGARWCDFVSFDDRLPAGLQLVVIRVERSAVDVAGYERTVRAFLAEVDAAVTPLQGLSPVEFFRRAPIDVVRQVAVQCRQAIEARRGERPGAVVRRVGVWQPHLLQAR